MKKELGMKVIKKEWGSLEVSLYEKYLSNNSISNTVSYKNKNKCIRTPQRLKVQPSEAEKLQDKRTQCSNETTIQFSLFVIYTYPRVKSISPLKFSWLHIHFLNVSAPLFPVLNNENFNGKALSIEGRRTFLVRNPPPQFSRCAISA